MRFLGNWQSDRSVLALLLVLASVLGCEPLRPKALIQVDPLSISLGTGALILRAEVEVKSGVLDPDRALTIIVPQLPIAGLNRFATIYLEPVSQVYRDPATRPFELPSGQHAWVGRRYKRGRSSDPLPLGQEAFVMLFEDHVEARVQLGHKVYRLHATSATKAVLEVYDDTRFSEHRREVQKVGAVLASLEKAVADPPCKDTEDQIDVMVLYTDGAESAAVGATTPDPVETLIENEIAFAVEQANELYAASYAALHLHPVHVGRVPEELKEPPYVPLLDSLSWFAHDVERNPQVLSLRESTRADLVVVLYEFAELGTQVDCGFTGQVDSASAATRQDAFAVVRRSCAGTYLSFAHEVGHIMGAGHQRSGGAGAGGVGGGGLGGGGASGLGGSDFNHGHAQIAGAGGAGGATHETVLWRTVMTTNEVCEDGAGGAGGSADKACERVRYLSSPHLEFEQFQTGVAGKEDNVLAHNNNATAVSRYRCSKTVQPRHVWIKDHWADEGGQPDTATLGLPMWNSPDIWVRTSEDGTKITGEEWWEDLEHAHVHEEPVLGGTNHVYVKLHNNGEQVEEGDLELYFAKASANPTSWVEIGKLAKLKVGRGVHVAKFEWSAPLPPNSGNSLLARWNTDHSPLAITNLVDQVRAQKGLAWRSASVVALSPQGEFESSFRIQGSASAAGSYYLLITTQNDAPRLDWGEVVAVSVEVDESRFVQGGLTLGGGLIQSVSDRGVFDFELERTSTRLIGPFELDANDSLDFKLVSDASDEAAFAAQPSHRSLVPPFYEIMIMQVPEEALMSNGVVIIPKNSDALLRDGDVVGGLAYTLRFPAELPP